MIIGTRKIRLEGHRSSLPPTRSSIEMASSRGAAAAVDKENVAPAGGPAARSTRRKGLGAMPAAGNVQQQQQQEAGAEGGSVVKKAAAAAVVCGC